MIEWIIKDQFELSTKKVAIYKLYKKDGPLTL